MDIEIRKATLNDVNTISRIYALSWKTAYKAIVPQKYLDELKTDFWVPSLEKRIKSGTAKAMLVCENDTPVGCAVYGRARDQSFPDFGEIVSLYLLPGFFRKGCGKKLMQEVIADMKADGFEKFYLWVLKENAGARKFYENCGFTYSGDECTCEIMQKQLVDVRYILKT